MSEISTSEIIHQRSEIRDPRFEIRHPTSPIPSAANKPVTIYLPLFRVLAGGRNQISQLAVGSLKYFQSGRWFLIQTKYPGHELN